MLCVCMAACRLMVLGAAGTGEVAAVQVDAGVITIDLLNYLANYVTARAPAGWTL
ncbi:hypothetical protein HaLaN_24200, partial [Haematococcus lacustris]